MHSPARPKACGSGELLRFSAGFTAGIKPAARELSAYASILIVP